MIVKEVFNNISEYNDLRKFKNDKETINFALNPNNVLLVRSNLKKGLEQSFGYHLRKDNYLEKLVIWCAKMWPQKNWYDIDFYYNCSDGGYSYKKSKALIKACLIYTCLSSSNRCISFKGVDNKYYRL